MTSIRPLVIAAHKENPGRPFVDIADQFNISRQRVYAILRSEGITSKPGDRRRWGPRSTPPKPLLYRYGNGVRICPGDTGAISELDVCAHLMRRGVHVFRAQSPHAPCDLIALHGNRAYRVEVKSAKLSGKRTVFPAPSSDRFDVLALALPDGTVILRPDPFDEKTSGLTLDSNAG